MCGDDQAPFPAALIFLLERDRSNGHVSFCYATETGRQSFVISHVRELLEAARRTPAKHRKRAIEHAHQFISHHDELSKEIARQWSAHIKALVARYEQRKAAATMIADSAPRKDCFA